MLHLPGFPTLVKNFTEHFVTRIRLFYTKVPTDLPPRGISLVEKCTRLL